MYWRADQPEIWSERGQWTAEENECMTTVNGFLIDEFRYIFIFLSYSPAAEYCYIA